MNNNLDLLIPEILVGSLAFIILGLDLFLKPKFKEYIAYIASAGLILIFMFSIIPIWNTKANIYGDILVLDGYAVFFKSIFLILGAILISYNKLVSKLLGKDNSSSKEEQADDMKLE